MKEVDEFVHCAIQAYMDGNRNNADEYLINIYRRINNNPSLISESRNLANLGKSFLLMLDRELFSDIDVLQRIATLGYFCLSKAIKEEETNPYVFGDRQLLICSSYDVFKYTIMEVNNKNGGIMDSFFNSGLSEIETRNIMFQLEFFDMAINPILAEQNEYYRNRLLELTGKLERGMFSPIMTSIEMVDEGARRHDELYDYLKEEMLG